MSGIGFDSLPKFLTEIGHQYVHRRFRDKPRNQPNQNLPDYVKHAFFLHRLPSEHRRARLGGRN